MNAKKAENNEKTDCALWAPPALGTGHRLAPLTAGLWHGLAPHKSRTAGATAPYGPSILLVSFPRQKKLTLCDNSVILSVEIHRSYICVAQRVSLSVAVGLRYLSRRTRQTQSTVSHVNLALTFAAHNTVMLKHMYTTLQTGRARGLTRSDPATLTLLL